MSLNPGQRLSKDFAKGYELFAHDTRVRSPSWSPTSSPLYTDPRHTWKTPSVRGSAAQFFIQILHRASASRASSYSVALGNFSRRLIASRVSVHGRNRFICYSNYICPRQIRVITAGKSSRGLKLSSVKFPWRQRRFSCDLIDFSTVVSSFWFSHVYIIRSYRSNDSFAFLANRVTFWEDEMDVCSTRSLSFSLDGWIRFSIFYEYFLPFQRSTFNLKIFQFLRILYNCRVQAKGIAILSLKSRIQRISRNLLTLSLCLRNRSSTCN